MYERFISENFFFLEDNQMIEYSLENVDKKYKTFRLGVYGDGSCFLHAFFKGLCSQEYAKLDKYEQISILNQFRENVADTLNEDKFLDYNQGNTAKNVFFKLYTSLVVDENENKMPFWQAQKINEENYSIIAELVGKFSTLRIKNELMKYRNFSKLLLTLTLIVNTCYDRFLSIIKTPGSEIEDDEIIVFQDMFDVNVILIMDGKIYGKEWGCERKATSNIFLYYTGNHYELIVLQRAGEFITKFNSDDKFIQDFLKAQCK